MSILFIPLAEGKMSCLACSLLCSLSADRRFHPSKSSREAKVSYQCLAVSLGSEDGKGEPGTVPACLLTSMIPVFSPYLPVQRHPVLVKHLVSWLTHIFC